MSLHHRALRYLGIAVALVALCAITPAFAQPVVGLHLASVHEPQSNYSNDNPGVYVRLDDRWQVGVYRNSHRRTSWYASHAWHVGPVAVAAGLVTGYDRRPGGPTCEAVTADLRMHRANSGELTSSVHCWRDTGTATSRVIPFASLSVALPAVAGVTPRLTYLPRVAGMGAHVLHLSIERSL